MEVHGQLNDLGKRPQYHWIGVWVNFKASLDVYGFTAPTQNQITMPQLFSPQSRQQSPICLEVGTCHHHLEPRIRISGITHLLQLYAFVAWVPLLYPAYVYKWQHLKESLLSLNMYLKNLSMGDDTLLYGACRLTRIYKLTTELNVR